MIRRLGINPAALAYAMTTLGSGMINNIFSFYYVKLFLNKYKISEGAFHQSQVSIFAANTQCHTSPTINKYCVHKNKIITVSVKILHKMYPVKEALRSKNVEESCVFCQTSRETTCYLFYHFMINSSELEEFLITKFKVNIQNNILMSYCAFNYTGLSKNITFLIFICLLLRESPTFTSVSDSFHNLDNNNKLHLFHLD